MEIVTFFRFEFINQDKITLSSARTFPNFPIWLAKCASIRFLVKERPKKIFYYQPDVETLGARSSIFLLLNKREYKNRIFQSAVLVSIFMLQIYITFSLFLNIWLRHKFFLMKINSLHWNGVAYTCKEKLWWRVAGEYQILQPPFF